MARTQWCIILSSDYQSQDKPLNLEDVTDRTNRSQEVQKDSELVRQILLDHFITEIPINIDSNPSDIKRSIENILGKIQTQGITSCHIVLNSHGDERTRDLKNAAVITTISCVSQFGIPISQISALMCHAMALSVAENLTPTDLEQRKHIPIVRSIDSLVKEFRHLRTFIPQTFQIYGYHKGYDPNTEKGEEIVKSILLDRTATSISIHVEAMQDSNQIMQTLKQCIHFLKDNNLHRISRELEKKYHPQNGGYQANDETENLDSLLRAIDPQLTSDNFDKVIERFKGNACEFLSELRIFMYNQLKENLKNMPIREELKNFYDELMKNHPKKSLSFNYSKYKNTKNIYKSLDLLEKYLQSNPNLDNLFIKLNNSKFQEFINQFSSIPLLNSQNLTSYASTDSFETLTTTESDPRAARSDSNASLPTINSVASLSSLDSLNRITNSPNSISISPSSFFSESPLQKSEFNETKEESDSPVKANELKK